VPITALVFDLDGLIIDTESAEFGAWSQVCAEHGVDLPLDLWAANIGTLGQFDPRAHLRTTLGREVDDADLSARVLARFEALMDGRGPLPGVLELIGAAHQAELGLAVASSSGRDWVQRYVTQVGLADAIGVLACREDVAEVKPSPALYEVALARLEVAPCDAIAFEDSWNGLRAAKAAGLWCVAVPNEMTAAMDFSAADLMLNSLADTSLGALLERFA
jgi:HAD superfamily hydrolase (TIGR01509 family)